MKRRKAAAFVRERGLIAIMRGRYAPDDLRSIADALASGGVRIVEVTLGSEGALEGITALRRHAEDRASGERLLVGAGTVRTARDVERALDAGAQFLVSPNFDPESAARAQEAGVLHLPGVFTASEAQRALAAGCRMQKLFPAGHADPSYLSALRAPLSDIDFVPTGGITPERLGPFVEAGAAAFGVGSALVADADPEATAERARRLVDALRAARGARTPKPAD
jgi:2-dehydro-3-deoxyphosphogluconate aldolase/(4S)-4-hydroxy-2-oxoglutarate aldolase